ncbi:MAG: ribulose-phosphate 3-epimerase [Devosia sp.]|nr:ribulose-phosphate 3-epimerase [Devosia sp.]
MSPRPIRIAPSILSADFSRLADEVTAIADSGADYIHVDVMDGHFVPNISFGAVVMKAIRAVTDKPFDVHLMISPVDAYLAEFANSGADIITVHAEAGPHLHRSLQAIRALGKKAGVALNPATPVSAIQHVIDDVDLVLVMSVNPGFGGQSFLPESLAKLRQTKALIGSRDIDLEVDGGVTADNARAIADAGANVFVAGSSVYAGNDPATYAGRIAAIRAAATGRTA